MDSLDGSLPATEVAHSPPALPAGALFTPTDTENRVHAKVTIVTQQRQKPLRSSYGAIVQWFDEHEILQNTRRLKDQFPAKSSHEAGLLGVIEMLQLIPKDVPVTIKCSHKSVDTQLHRLADLYENGWRGVGGSRLTHSLLLQEIQGAKANRANVEFVTPRRLVAGPYAQAMELALEAINEP